MGRTHLVVGPARPAAVGAATSHGSRESSELRAERSVARLMLRMPADDRHPCRRGEVFARADNFDLVIWVENRQGRSTLIDEEAVMRNSKLVGFLTLSLALVLSASVVAAPTKVEQERQEIRKKAHDILGRLYKLQPSAKASIDKAAGYAVFSNFGMKIFVAGSGTGKGLAVDNKSKKEVFMKMIELQAGLGIGVKKFSLVWVFETPETLDQFVNSGWELGGQTSLAAKAGEKGAAFQGAMAVSPGIWLYQLTDTGLALELTAKGTKYYKNDDLN